MLLVLGLCALSQPTRAAQPDLATRLLAGSEGQPFAAAPPWRVGEARHAPGELSLPVLHPTAPSIDLRLVPRGSTEGRFFAQTPSFDIYYRGSLNPEGAFEVLEALVARIRSNDPGGLSLGSPAPGPSAAEAGPRAGPPPAQGMSHRERYLVGLTCVLLALGLLVLLGLVAPVVVAAVRARPAGERRWVWGVIAVGAALRAFLPYKLVTIFKAYEQTAEVIAFEAVPKYGAGAFTLYHGAIDLFGADHAVLVGVNRAAGVLSLPVLVALLARFRPARWGVLIGAALLALLPALVRDPLTESNMVPTALWLWCTLLLWDVWLESAATRRRPTVLAGAAVCAALAVLGRPAMLLAVPAGLLLLAQARRRLPVVRQRWVLVGVVAAAFAALLTPHLLHLWGETLDQTRGDALPALRWELLSSLPAKLLGHNLVLRPAWFPLALTAVALWAAWRLPDEAGRRFSRALWILALVLVASSQVDLPEPSIPRLQAPAAALITLAGALGLAHLAPRERHGPRWWGGALAGLVLLSALPGAWYLFAPTNEDAEEAFLREAYQRLPDDARCLVHLGSHDPPPPGKTHRHVPRYLAPDRVAQMGIGYWASEDGRRVCATGASYFVQGLRCYAQLQPEGAPPRERPVLLEGCSELRRQARLQPVFERSLENLGQNVFGYYPDVPRFEVGLYRLDRSGTAQPAGTPR